MKVRSILLGAAVLAGATLAPGRASAQGAPCFANTYAASLGLGGFLSGCFQFTLTELGENAGGVGSQYYWTNGGALLGTGAPSNASSIGAGTSFFTDDCNSTGIPGYVNFKFCDGVEAPVKTTGPGTITNLTGELVLGMNVTQPGENGGVNYWIFSGAAARNSYPAPPGFQAVLYDITSAGVSTGDFLFAWEDINSACTGVAGSALHPSLTTFEVTDLTNKQKLDDPNNCNSFSGATTSDNDFNDSYIVLHIIGDRKDTVVPEPMTMTLMATGLVGLAGAQIRRRKKNQG